MTVGIFPLETLRAALDEEFLEIFRQIELHFRQITSVRSDEPWIHGASGSCRIRSLESLSIYFTDDELPARKKNIEISRSCRDIFGLQSVSELSLKFFTVLQPHRTVRHIQSDPLSARLPPSLLTNAVSSPKNLRDDDDFCQVSRIPRKSRIFRFR